MRNLMIAFIPFLLILSALSGCIGLIVAYTDECQNEAPYPNINDVFFVPPGRGLFDTSNKNQITYDLPTKNAFLSSWGKPDTIVTLSENKETWVYDRNRWCGAVPVFFVPAPLILPVCEGYDRVTFENDQAIYLNTKRTSLFAFMLLPPMSGHDHQCKYPVPLKPSYSPDKPLADNFGVIVFYFSGKKNKTVEYYDIYVDDQLLFPIFNNSSYAYASSSGQKAIKLGNSTLTLNVERGQTYYIKVEKSHFYRPPNIEMVPSSVGEEESALCRKIIKN